MTQTLADTLEALAAKATQVPLEANIKALAQALVLDLPTIIAALRERDGLEAQNAKLVNFIKNQRSQAYAFLAKQEPSQ